MFRACPIHGTLYLTVCASCLWETAKELERGLDEQITNTTPPPDFTIPTTGAEIERLQKEGAEAWDQKMKERHAEYLARNPLLAWEQHKQRVEDQNEVNSLLKGMGLK